MEEKGKKRTSSKTLQTAREAGYFGKKMLTATHNAVEEGRPVAWSMFEWWLGASICKALGVELVFPENYGAFCAASRAAEEYLDYSEMDGFPATLCGYARNCFGYARKLKENNYIPPDNAPGGGMPRPTFLLGSGLACDARYKWFQALGRYMDVPVWTLESPQTGLMEYYLKGNKEANIRFMTAQLREFVSFLEKLLGKKLDRDKLSEMLETMFATHRLAYEISLMRQVVPTPMVSTDFWSLMIPHLYMPEDKEALAFYQRAHKEVKEKADQKIGAIPNEKYRMMFTELPPWHTLGFFDDMAEKHGIAFVMESWSYQPPPPLPEEERHGVSDPLELLARYNYHKFHHAAPIARKYDVEPIYIMSSYLQWGQDYRADGVMCHPLLSCRPATYTLMHLRNLLAENFKIPSVVVDGDIVDLRVFNVEEAHAKMDAFIETMDYHRELRKKAGMAW